MKTNDGGPAFPSQQRLENDGMWNQSYEPGMTYREYVAAQALAGFCLQATGRYEKGPCNHAIVERSVVLADALIAELEKSQ